MESPCKQCGNTVESVGRGRPRVYCLSCRPRQAAPKPREPHACAQCGEQTTRPRFCSARCKEKFWAGIQLAKSQLTCAVCSEPIWPGGKGRLPQGQAICRPCRRKRERVASPVKLIQPRPSKPRGKTTERGYGSHHQRLRRYLLSVLIEGSPCARCGQPMSKDQPLDLDHSDDRTAYLGLSHRHCNRATSGPPIAGLELVRQCHVCGSSIRQPKRGVRTCSRACGWELRRRAA